jgi:hypothetical protein
MKHIILCLSLILSINTFAQVVEEPANEQIDSVKYYLDMPEVHRALITGIWIPTGELKIFGVHPEFGWQIGTKRKKMNYDLTVIGRFLKSANNYEAYRSKNSPPEQTDTFLGGHFSFDVGRDIVAVKGHELQLTSGIAFEGFNALEKDKERDLDLRAANTYNLSVGLNYRFYITSKHYLGLRAKYNIVDYTLNNVVDYKGNAVSIQLLFGAVDNYYKTEGLNRLKIKHRK